MTRWSYQSNSALWITALKSHLNCSEYLESSSYISLTYFEVKMSFKNMTVLPPNPNYKRRSFLTFGDFFPSAIQSFPTLPPSTNLPSRTRNSTLQSYSVLSCLEALDIFPYFPASALILYPALLEPPTTHLPLFEISPSRRIWTKNVLVEWYQASCTLSYPVALNFLFISAPPQYHLLSVFRHLSLSSYQSGFLSIYVLLKVKTSFQRQYHCQSTPQSNTKSCLSTKGQPNRTDHQQHRLFPIRWFTETRRSQIPLGVVPTILLEC
jgi:hypothetical protein